MRETSSSLDNFYVTTYVILIPSLLDYWKCITNITKSCYKNHSYYIDHRNRILIKTTTLFIVSMCLCHKTFSAQLCNICTIVCKDPVILVTGPIQVWPFHHKALNGKMHNVTCSKSTDLFLGELYNTKTYGILSSEWV